jgi:hypothetical protein
VQIEIIKDGRGEKNAAGAGLQPTHHKFVRVAIGVSGGAIVEGQRRTQRNVQTFQRDSDRLVYIGLSRIKVIVNDPATGSIGTGWPNVEVKPEAVKVTKSLTGAALAACAPMPIPPATSALNNKTDRFIAEPLLLH